MIEYTPEPVAEDDDVLYTPLYDSTVVVYALDEHYPARPEPIYTMSAILFCCELMVRAWQDGNITFGHFGSHVTAVLRGVFIAIPNVCKPRRSGRWDGYTHYRIAYCPFCGKPIQVVSEAEAMTMDFNSCPNSRLVKRLCRPEGIARFILGRND